MIAKLLLVALGGACGASLRFLSVSAFMRVTGEVAWGTLFVNVAGSFLMGLAVVVLTARFPDAAPRALPFLTAGVLGGFTTFSAFSLDAVRLIEDGRLAWAGAYILGSVMLSVLALVAGMAVGRAV